MKISSNDVGDSNDEINFLDKLLLSSTNVYRLRKAFVNGLPANRILSKTQLYKTEKSREVLGGPVGSLLKNGLFLMKNQAVSASAANAAIHKKSFLSGTCPLGLADQIALINSNEGVSNMKIVNSVCY